MPRLFVLVYISIIASASTAHSFTARQMTEIPTIDPALLAERHNITCLGEAYDLELPLQEGWNPNTVSVQKLCAKTKYGGGPPGRNIGG